MEGVGWVTVWWGRTGGLLLLWISITGESLQCITADHLLLLLSYYVHLIPKMSPVSV